MCGRLISDWLPRFVLRWCWVLWEWQLVKEIERKRFRALLKIRHNMTEQDREWTTGEYSMWPVDPKFEPYRRTENQRRKLDRMVWKYRANLVADMVPSQKP